MTPEPIGRINPSSTMPQVDGQGLGFALRSLDRQRLAENIGIGKKPPKAACRSMAFTRPCEQNGSFPAPRTTLESSQAQRVRLCGDGGQNATCAVLYSVGIWTFSTSRRCGMWVDPAGPHAHGRWYRGFGRGRCRRDHGCRYGNGRSCRSPGWGSDRGCDRRERATEHRDTDLAPLTGAPRPIQLRTELPRKTRRLRFAFVLRPLGVPHRMRVPCSRKS